ncbi:hypothetical protein HF086_017514 [Spodoptera exigua]|uniref:Cadherin domain-containing protein n=3 Tax=Spodoptera exigua TaxID=7107 RepID=A0A922MDS7_SPOEX|nr:hypothetical protein HF086_017514 [Spodoptera exigua]
MQARVTSHPPRVRLKPAQYKCITGFWLLLTILEVVVANRPPRFLIDGQSEIVVRLKEGPDTPVVEDVNDNEPIFKPYPSAITVKEDASPGILATVEATDQDEGAYGQVLYHLQELDGDIQSFAIQTVNGKGVIRLTNRLDYERKSLYQLRVLAVDRANQGRVNTGTAAILVKVQDVEDQPPEFVVASPVTRISEDAPIGTSVLQVRAIDGDRGINNRISYSIISGGEEHFDIDSSSGVVYTVNQLDREDPNNSNGAYILEILATEESRTISPMPSATTEVTVIVTDVNDETPRFRNDRYVGEVIENAQQNTPITFLQDAIPEGKNGTFELYLTGDHGVFDVTPFKGINEASFLIRVNDASFLDYEKVTVMNFSLVAKEIVTKDPKMSIVPIVVHIKDENDNFPEFTESLYTVSIPENCGVGTTVAWVQALDQDSDNYGTRGIRYTSLGGSIANLLNLNPISGVITVKQAGGDSFDRELISRHYLTVEARDDLGKGNRNTAQLIINIEDVNDNAPMFLANKYEASHIEYSIVGGEYKDNFTIDPNLGIITPVGGLDFEQIPGDNSNLRPIHLTVRARDFGEPSLSSTVPVTIYVQDVNDHAPLFQQMMYKRSIPEDMPGGTSVLEVKARDADGSSPNNRVVYRIQRGASDKFVIESRTGVVSVANGSTLDPDKTTPKSNRYTLTVVGTQIYRASAHDPDDQPVLRYAIDKASSVARDEDGIPISLAEYDFLALWDLNAVDGTLKVVRFICKLEIVKLVITVEDMAAIDGGPRQTASATLTIVVDDENDNNPVFRKPMYKASITENSKNGVNIATVIADDADKNKSMNYFLEGREDLLNLVHMDSKTGEVVVASKIDHELYPWINLTVKGVDSGVPPRYSVVDLFIQSTVMEKSLKIQIVDAAEAVKKKIRKMRDFDTENKQALESVFRPVTESLNLIANSNKQTDPLRSKEVEETKIPCKNDTLQQDYTINGGESDVEENECYTDSDESYQSLGDNNPETNTSSWSISSEALSDIPFGVRTAQGQLMLDKFGHHIHKRMRFSELLEFNGNALLKSESGDFDLKKCRLRGIRSPVDPDDAVNKDYVDRLCDQTIKEQNRMIGLLRAQIIKEAQITVQATLKAKIPDILIQLEDKFYNKAEVQKLSKNSP